MTKSQKRRSRMRQTAVRKSVTETAGLKESLVGGCSVDFTTRDLLFMVMQRLDVLQFTFQHLFLPGWPPHVNSFCNMDEDPEEVYNESLAEDSAGEFEPVVIAGDPGSKLDADTTFVDASVAPCIQSQPLAHESTGMPTVSPLRLLVAGCEHDEASPKCVTYSCEASCEASVEDEMGDVPGQTEPAPNQASEADLRFLAGLRGQQKQDMVLNLFLNRSCSVEGIPKVLDDIEKYFENDGARLASFFGMKFGFANAGWHDCRAQLVATAASLPIEPDVQVSVGSVLAHIRRTKSEKAPGPHDTLRERAERLVRPRRKKHK